MMEAVRPCETLVNSFQSTRRYNPEDGHLRSNEAISCTHNTSNLQNAFNHVFKCDEHAAQTNVTRVGSELVTTEWRSAHNCASSTYWVLLNHTVSEVSSASFFRCKNKPPFYVVLSGRTILQFKFRRLRPFKGCTKCNRTFTRIANVIHFNDAD
jgi:hypothetical protein